MFERNKTSENNSNMQESTSKKRQNPNLSSVNMVSEGTEIIGKLITQSDIRIAGKVEGEAQADGKVIVASTGNVEGNVNAQNADIAGRVEGEVHVDNKLTLRQSAVVECDIYTQNLVVEEGATFNGECHMRDYSQKNENKPKKDQSKKKKPGAESLSEDGEEKVSV